MRLQSALACRVETGQCEYQNLLPHKMRQEAIFLEQSFCVTVCGKHAGKVLVQKLGLYYHFHCRCILTDFRIYRLMVTCGTVRENLGILVPKEGSFVLDTKLPMKRIGEGEMIFTLIPKRENHSGTFVPISPEEPFAYITRLKQSFLILRNGQPGILIDKVQE